MQTFQFRLDRVLEWRRKKLQIEEGRLAACLCLVQAVETKIERLRAERKSIERGLLDRAAIPAAEFLNLSRYRLRASQEEREMVEERRRRLVGAEEQRLRARHAQQEVKLLEKMRGRRLEEHAALAAHEVEDAAAEAYLSRWSQARRAESSRRRQESDGPADDSSQRFNILRTRESGDRNATSDA